MPFITLTLFLIFSETSLLMEEFQIVLVLSSVEIKSDIAVIIELYCYWISCIILLGTLLLLCMYSNPVDKGAFAQNVIWIQPEANPK